MHKRLLGVLYEYIHIRKDVVLIMFKKDMVSITFIALTDFLTYTFLHMQYATGLLKFGNIYAFNKKRRSKYENLGLII